MDTVRKDLFLIFMLMDILPACIYVHHMSAWYPPRSERTLDILELVF